LRLASWTTAILLAAAAPGAPAVAQNVLTGHNDTSRTGWNSHEKTLTVANVGGGQFDLQQSVVLDNQVDTQPLVVKNQSIAGRTVPIVVYVATANDTVYAIDGTTGAILLSKSLGTPVPQSALPGQCSNNAPSIGVDSTPAISTASQTLYLIADSLVNGAPVLTLHALGLGTLQDVVAPVPIVASHLLADGSNFSLDPFAARQRSALLLSGDTLYAGFASYCDIRADISRGWVLGWNASSLAPLSANQLNNRAVNAPDDFYLSSVWMSGSGLAAAAPNGSIYFTTGNSDYSGTTHNAATNLSESLLRVAPDLARVQGRFTPDNEVELDQDDEDFGSGGVMLPPPQAGAEPQLAAAAGKDGQLYLLNRKQANGPPLGAYSIGQCWCAPAYFTGSDGVGRIVTSGGSTLMTWRLETSPSAPATLVQQTSTPIVTGQDPGFFTSVSSNGTAAGSAVIWAVARPTDSDPADVTLYAVDPGTGNVIYSAVAGTWPNTGGNANIVPTVADGHVYVASDGELAIFGLGNPAPAAAQSAMLSARAATARASAHILVLASGEHAISGRIVRVDQSALTLRERNGVVVHADIATARRNSELAVPVVGRAVLVVGAYAPDGVLSVHYMQRIKRSPALWPANR
jgi:hypothetical protein